MTTLDGVERTFDADTVLVCDRNGPSGIAGIMGGRSPRSPSATTRVLLEVATWNGVNILRTSRKLGLRSDASNRFEKQLHPELALRGTADRLEAAWSSSAGRSSSRDDRRVRRDPGGARAASCGPSAWSALLGDADRAEALLAST